MGALRRPTPEEEKFIAFMIKKSSKSFRDTWKKDLMVSSIDVGESGSLNLFPDGKVSNNREFGDQISEYVFKDKDRVEVVASLNIDDKGNLFELDIWKADFSDLIQFPAV